MNQIQIFKNEQFGSVRTINKDGEPLFAGVDIAKALGYQNTKDALIKHVDECDKEIIQRSQIATLENHIPKSAFPANFVDGNIPNRGLLFINESGLYSLILSSKLPKAKEFKHWVTSDILPTIRKHGVYAIEEVLNDPDMLINALTALKEEREAKKKLEAENQKQALQITEMQPKVLFADAVSTSTNEILVRDLAKLIKQNGVDIGEKRLWKWLREHEYICKNSTMPTQKAMNLKLFKNVEYTIAGGDGQPLARFVTKVTGKGQVYFVNKFYGKASEADS